MVNVAFATSSQIELLFDEAIGTACSIDRNTIQLRGYQSLNANDNQKLSLMAKGYETIGVNGTDFLNGPINLDKLEGVEVIVGPASFFEPANTLVVTVNVITRKMDGSAISVTTGSDVDYCGTFEAGKQWDDEHRFSLSLSGEKRDGVDVFDFIFSCPDSTFDTSNPSVLHYTLIDDESCIIGSPRLTINVGTTIEMAHDVFFSPSIRYMAKQSAFDIQRSEFRSIDNRWYLDAVLCVHKLNLSSRIKKPTGQPGSYCRELAQMRISAKRDK